MSNGKQSPPKDVPKKPRVVKPPKPLQGDSAKQYTNLKSIAKTLLEGVSSSNIPAMHLRKFKSELSESFAALLKSRKVDPKTRAKEKLQSRLDKIKSQISDLG